jgi:hypothetical protein
VWMTILTSGLKSSKKFNTTMLVTFSILYVLFYYRSLALICIAVLMHILALIGYGMPLTV